MGRSFATWQYTPGPTSEPVRGTGPSVRAGRTGARKSAATRGGARSFSFQAAWRTSLRQNCRARGNDRFGNGSIISGFIETLTNVGLISYRCNTCKWKMCRLCSGACPMTTRTRRMKQLNCTISLGALGRAHFCGRNWENGLTKIGAGRNELRQ